VGTRNLSTIDILKRQRIEVLNLFCRKTFFENPSKWWMPSPSCDGTTTMSHPQFHTENFTVVLACFAVATSHSSHTAVINSGKQLDGTTLNALRSDVLQIQPIRTINSNCNGPFKYKFRFIKVFYIITFLVLHQLGGKIIQGFAVDVE
jgi:hypothetical protein